MKYYDEQSAGEAESPRQEAARLSVLLFLIGVGWMYLLNELLPSTGLAAMITIPASVGAVLVLSTGYFFYSRRQPTDNAGRPIFWWFAATIIFIATLLHPQVSGKNSFVALWELITG